MKNHVMKFVSNEEGLTTVEYAIAGAMVGAAVIAAFVLLGGNVRTVIAAIAGVIGGIQIN